MNLRQLSPRIFILTVIILGVFFLASNPAQARFAITEAELISLSTIAEFSGVLVSDNPGNDDHVYRVGLKATYGTDPSKLENTTSMVYPSADGYFAISFRPLTSSTQYYFRVVGGNSGNGYKLGEEYTPLESFLSTESSPDTDSGSDDTSEYSLLSPLPGMEDPVDLSEGGAGLSKYIEIIFDLAIALATVLAVIMLVLGGIQYMSTDAITDKDEGKKKMQNALGGLVLALGAFLILNTINPNLTDLKISIQKVTLKSLDAPHECKNGVCCPGKTRPDTGGQYVEGDAWPGDATERGKLEEEKTVFTATGYYDLYVEVKKPVCDHVGQRNCTSVFGLSQGAIDKIRTLEKNCGEYHFGLTTGVYRTPCKIVVTEGTACWLHSEDTNHQPGASVGDIRTNERLKKYILEEAKKKDVKPEKTEYGLKYSIPGLGVFLEETQLPHWHVEL